MEDDTCLNEHELETAAAMAACGIPVSLRVNSISTTQSVAIEETYVLPSSRFAALNGTVIALEPSRNEGSYRAIPQNARVLSFTVTPLALPLTPMTGGKLDLVLVVDPYSITFDAATAQKFPCISLSDGNVSAAVDAAIALKQSAPGAYNPLAERGIQTRFAVLTPSVNGNPQPVFSNRMMYPAVRFVGDAQNPVFPPEVDYSISIAYEVSRAI